MRILSLLAAALAMPALIARAEPAAAARELIARVLPGQAGSFVCEVIPQDAGKDVFEIEARDGKIVLRGNHGIAIATAFNWYLRQHCLVNYDWQAAGPLRLPAAPPPNSARPAPLPSASR